MRNVYDTLCIEAILDEQHSEFSNAALGTLKPPTVEVIEGLEAEIVVVREWKEDRIGLMDLLVRLEGLQRRPAAILKS